MRIIRGIRNLQEKLPSAVVALGKFDGIHLGHAMILKRAKAEAERIGGTSVVYTFEPHPLKVLAPEKNVQLITIFRKKMELIASAGIDVAINAEFDMKFAMLHPRDFAKDVLADHIGARKIVVGENFSFGKGRMGNIEHLAELGREMGFEVETVPGYKLDGMTVSSTAIRDFVQTGRIDEANRFLGRYFSLEGKVIRGFRMGRTIGFPTANLDTPYEIIPDTGVYAVWVRIRRHEKPRKGVVNIGFNPTFNREQLSIEVHVLDYAEEIYGKEIEICFVSRLRDEKKFPSAGELASQISADIESAHSVLNTHPAPPGDKVQ